MATYTAHPSGYDEEHSNCYSVNNFESFIGQSTEDGYSSANVVPTMDSAYTAVLYIKFDLSSIPQNATINSVTASIKTMAPTYSSYGGGAVSFNAMYGTSTMKGDMVAATAYTYQEQKIVELTNCGTWTREELDDARIRVFFTYKAFRGKELYFLGANFTVDYTVEGGGGGGGGDDPEPQPSGDTIDFPFTGLAQSRMLTAGKYILEAWGAQGGSWNGNEGGKGGYSTGLITLSQNTTVYVYVGGQPDTVTGTTSSVHGGFNGGGKGQNRTWNNVTTYGQGGGGASDIRIGHDSLYSRVLVAGGGGGVASTNGTNKHGGGVSGGSGGQSSSASYVAGQTAPTTSGNFLAGTFGQGADAYQDKSNYQHGSGGGGGGWYGGYAYNDANDSSEAFWGYNGGGSGYVYTAGTAGNYPSGCLLDSSYYLEDAETIGGNTPSLGTDGTSETGHSGNGYVRITPVTHEPTTEIQVFEYTQDAPYEVTLEPGTYILACWGAQGGSYQSNEGGKGGFSQGTLTLTQATKVFVNVGQQPPTTTTRQSATPGGYNGGGAGFNRDYSNTYTYGQGGGGASDIRVSPSGNLLYSRIIVAGGGGGAAGNNDSNKFGGGERAGAGGQQQTAAYNAGQTPPTTSNYFKAGTFGAGAAAYTQRKNYKYGSGGGGGGWYGGYAYNYADDNGTAYQGYNGGGSGYVYTAETASYYPVGGSGLVSSTYYLTDAFTKGGNETFNSPNGTPETGHSGHGCVVIQKIGGGGDVELDTKLYIKVNGAWKKVKKVYANMFGDWVEMTESTLAEWKADHPSGTALEFVE